MQPHEHEWEQIDQSSAYCLGCPATKGGWPEMSRGVVTFNSLGRYGRFANQLWQIAGVIGIARRNQFDFAFPEWINHDHRDRFGSSEDVDVQKYFVNPLPLYSGPSLPDRFIDWGYHDVVVRQSTSLSGHLQSPRYFEHCIDEVRHYFRMLDEPKPNDYCAIHLRRGDYDNAYHPRLESDYYREAVGRFPSNQRFLVFSDDQKAARLMFNENRFDFADGDYLTDFRLMKTCKHFIIANSAYSAMAAVLGEAPDKQVVAPRPWFGPAYTNITGEDIYNHDWTVINYQHARAPEAIAV